MSDPKPIAVLVEDEQQIRRFVRISLESEGWDVYEAHTLKAGIVEAGTRKPDLVILDLGLPDGDGRLLIRHLRTWSTVPIIVLSARSEEQIKIDALDTGADDYLTKPFGVGELLARVRSALRRRMTLSTEGGSTFRFGNVVVDLAARIVKKSDVQIHLTPIEYRLLGVLISNAGRVLTHRQLLREVWGPTHAESSHYLRIYMGHLRSKLEDDPARPRHLVTETAIGYRLEA